MRLSTYLIEVLMYLYYAKLYRYYRMVKYDAQKKKICFLKHFSKVTKNACPVRKQNTNESVIMEYDVRHWCTFCMVCAYCSLNSRGELGEFCPIRFTRHLSVPARFEESSFFDQYLYGVQPRRTTLGLWSEIKQGMSYD